MDIVLIRHATAIDETLELRDPMRMLTASGRAQAQQLGERLRERGCVPTHIWTSPLVRAVQTAELVAAGLRASCTVDVSPSAAPDESPRAVIRALHALPATACVLVVGHEPGLSAIGTLLVGGAELAALAKAEAVQISDGVERWRCAWDAR